MQRQRQRPKRLRQRIQPSLLARILRRMGAAQRAAMLASLSKRQDRPRFVSGDYGD